MWMIIISVVLAGLLLSPSAGEGRFSRLEPFGSKAEEVQVKILYIDSNDAVVALTVDQLLEAIGNEMSGRQLGPDWMSLIGEAARNVVVFFGNSIAEVGKLLGGVGEAIAGGGNVPVGVVHPNFPTEGFQSEDQELLDQLNSALEIMDYDEHLNPDLADAYHFDGSGLEGVVYRPVDAYGSFDRVGQALEKKKRLEARIRGFLSSPSKAKRFRISSNVSRKLIEGNGWKHVFALRNGSVRGRSDKGAVEFEIAPQVFSFIHFLAKSSGLSNVCRLDLPQLKETCRDKSTRLPTTPSPSKNLAKSLAQWVVRAKLAMSDRLEGSDLCRRLVPGMDLPHLNEVCYDKSTHQMGKCNREVDEMCSFEDLKKRPLERKPDNMDNAAQTQFASTDTSPKPPSPDNSNNRKD